MNELTNIWAMNKDFFSSKSLSQILAFAGDGKLTDGNPTSKEFRELLGELPSSMLKTFAEHCLCEKFDYSGFALQDIVNQLGDRLGFRVEYGLYRGRRNEIGYDGIWTSPENGYSLVVEVKTTDAYRINLDTIAEYRKRLVDSGKIGKADSSILIVVGREDTGDLEAQIRGSKHAWDIRLISTDALMQLLVTKETLNDTKTIQQINELLKPREYTRIDKLVDLIFKTSKDMLLSDGDQVQVEDREEDFSVHGGAKRRHKHSEEKVVPVGFHDECIGRIERKLQCSLIKQSKVAYANRERSIGIVCANSRTYGQSGAVKYWFAFHPHQEEYLKAFETAYVALGCGSADTVFLVPFSVFAPLLQHMWTTRREDRMYWHVVVYQRNDQYTLSQPLLQKGAVVDITNYKI